MKGAPLVAAKRRAPLPRAPEIGDHTLMANRALWVLGLGMVAASIVGCGGGGPADAPPSVMAPSFSPSGGTTASGGAASEVWWKHRLNGGVGMPVVSNGIPGTITYGDRLTRVTNGGTERIVTFNLTLTLSDSGGSATSHATNELDDTLVVGPPSAVVSETWHQEQQVSAPGMSEHVTIQAMEALATPLVDFGDRSDLDQLPVGHAEEATTRITTNASATASAPGFAPQTNTKTSITDVHVMWTVMAQLPSMMVLGNTYERVVQVQMQTDSTDTSTLMTTSQTETDWLAAGIGLIKGQKNADEFLPSGATAELIDTNLGLM
jgi:hypothetical protein